MIDFKISGSTNNIDKFLSSMSRGDQYTALQSYGQKGVSALSSATPTESGLTASSWVAKIERNQGRYSLSWYNTNMAGKTPVVILIQYGHGTGTGGYVQGRDFINPAIQPIFDEIANDVWEKVKRG